jgi:hypothetical protein
MTRVHSELAPAYPVFPTASAYLESLWQGPLARFTAGTMPTTMATAFNVLAQETLGTLAAWQAERRTAVAECILSRQHEGSGLFVPDSLTPADIIYPNSCDIHYIRLQHTYFCLSALDALDQPPRFGLAFARRFLNRDYALGWIDGGPWHDPWNHSNRIMFVLRFLIHFYEKEQVEHSMEVFDAILTRLDDLQSPRTGLWHGLHNTSDREAVFAAYHFFPFYAWRRRRIAHAERILDTALALQNDDDLFGFERGGGACEDLDTVDVLALLSRISEHRSDDVKQSLHRALQALLALQKEDGGFPNYLNNPIKPSKLLSKSSLKRIADDGIRWVERARMMRRVPPLGYRPYYYSGWKAVEGIRGESDAWGTWFRVLAVITILRRFPDFGAVPEHARFHRLPALGWHPMS